MGLSHSKPVIFSFKVVARQQSNRAASVHILRTENHKICEGPLEIPSLLPSSSESRAGTMQKIMAKHPRNERFVNTNFERQVFLKKCFAITGKL